MRPHLGLFVAYDDVKTRDVSNCAVRQRGFQDHTDTETDGGLRAAYATSHTSLHFDGSFNGGPGFFSGDETDKPVTPKGPHLATRRQQHAVHIRQQGLPGRRCQSADQQHPAGLPGLVGRG